MDGKFIEYMSLDNAGLCTQPVEDVRRTIEHAVNVFSFDPEEYVDTITTAKDGLCNLLLLSLHSAYYEATEQTWIDGRNEISNNRLKDICRSAAFSKYFDTYCSSYDEKVIDFFSKLAADIGHSLHRTNLQTFASFICYILGTKTDDTLMQTVKTICGDREHFYHMPLI